MNIQQIEKVISSPEILRGSFYMGDQPNKLDMRQFEKGIWMMTGKGGWCFMPEGLGIYSCHFGYKKKGLGEFALEHSIACFENMKILGARILIGYVAEKNTLAKRFLKKLGCESIGQKEGPFKFADKNTNLEVFEWRS